MAATRGKDEESTPFLLEESITPTEKLWLAAYYILSESPQPDKLAALVQSNPTLLTRTFTVSWRGQQFVDMTLLEIAGLVVSPNFRKNKLGEKDQYIAERFCCYDVIIAATRAEKEKNQQEESAALLPAKPSNQDILGESNTQSPSMSSFFHLSLERKLRLAAQYILSDYPNPDKLDALVQNDTTLLTRTISVAWRGSKLKEKTLLQIAAMAGDVNLRNNDPFEKSVGFKDHGMVERLSFYYPSPEEAQRQYNAVFPLGWEACTAARMKKYIEAAIAFMEGIIEIPDDNDLFKFQAACKLVIENFQKVLFYPAEEIITSGYIFDPQILDTVIDLYKAKARKDDFPFANSARNQIFWIHGFGSLQASLLGCDRQVLKKGIYSVVNKGERVLRFLTFAEAIDDPLAGLGTCFYLNTRGQKVSYDVEGHELHGGDWLELGGIPGPIKTYVNQKHERCKTYATTLLEIHEERVFISAKSNP